MPLRAHLESTHSTSHDHILSCYSLLPKQIYFLFHPIMRKWEKIALNCNFVKNQTQLYNVYVSCRSLPSILCFKKSYNSAV